MKDIKWGIIGLGNIAHSFASSLVKESDCELYAVASRSQDKAESFGAMYSVPKEQCYGSYELLLDDENIDVVYIALPHSLHKEYSIQALKCKKAVLCEKPSTMNESELKEVLAVAKQNNCFYMEAMKTRFLPAVNAAKQYVDDGRIGEIKHIYADFGSYSPYSVDNRLYNAEMGGGALLDVGVYPLSLSQYILGNQCKLVASQQIMSESKVDVSSSFTLKHEGGQLSQLFCSIETATKRSAIISGTHGYLELPMFSRANQLIIVDQHNKENIDCPHDTNGMEYQIREVNTCIRADKLESDVMSWEDSLVTMRIVDQINNRGNQEG